MQFLRRVRKRIGGDRNVLRSGDRQRALSQSVAQLRVQIRRREARFAPPAHKTFSDNLLKYRWKNERATHPIGFGVVAESLKPAADPVRPRRASISDPRLLFLSASGFFESSQQLLIWTPHPLSTRMAG